MFQAIETTIVPECLDNQNLFIILKLNFKKFYLASDQCKIVNGQSQDETESLQLICKNHKISDWESVEIYSQNYRRIPQCVFSLKIDLN